MHDDFLCDSSYFPIKYLSCIFKRTPDRNFSFYVRNYEESSKQHAEIEQFTHKQLKLHKNNFTQKLKELYILLEQNDLTTAQKILGEQIPLKDTDIICCTTLSLMVFTKQKIRMYPT